MNNFEIVFRNPWYLLVLLPSVMALLYLYLRTPRVNRMQLGCRIALGLRMAAAVLVTCVIAGLAFRMNTARQTVVILADASDSALQASAQAQETIRDITRLARENGADLKTLYFGGNTASDQDAVKSDATDIAAGLREAAAQLDSQRVKRILLISDGLETDGNAVSAANGLNGRGIRVDTMVLTAPGDAHEAETCEVILPETSILGHPMAVEIHVKSSFSGRGALRLYAEDIMVKEAVVGVTQGENVFRYTLVPDKTGTLLYSAELLMDGDTLPENNRAYAATHVQATEAVLIVEGREGQGGILQQKAQEWGYQVDRVTASQMPQSMMALCSYSLIVLMNVNVASLPVNVPERLEDYVSVYGRSVLAVGGDNTFLLGGMQDTPFERFLPVTMQVEEKESVQPIALLLLIDNSASMEGTAITMAKRGAVKSVQALNSNDYAGVISFSTEYGVLCGLTSMENRGEVISAIAGLGTVMGTVFTGALEEAYWQMHEFPADIRKHIVLISDGNPSDTGFESIIGQMAEDGITVSAIAIGSRSNVDLMASIAETGGGKCYWVESSYDLPNVMMSDTIMLQVDYQMTGTFIPRIVSRSFEMPETLPVIGGYIRTEAKPKAQVVLSTEKGHPLYVDWTYGAGRAACYMSDLSGAWNAAWYESAAGSAFIQSMLQSLMPENVKASSVQVTLERGGHQGLLKVINPDENFNIFSGVVTTPQGVSFPVGFTMMRDGELQRYIATEAVGLYTLDMQMSNETDAMSRVAFAASWSKEYEAFPRVNGQTVLEAVAHAGGGALLTKPEEFFAIETDSIRAEIDPSLWLAVLSFACILGQIIIRRFRFHKA